MKLILYYRLKTANAYLLFRELKLNIKEGTANERTRLFVDLLVYFIRKIKEKIVKFIFII